MSKQIWGMLQDSAITQSGCKASGLWVSSLPETISLLLRAGILKLLTKHLISKSLLYSLLQNPIIHLKALS